MPLTILAGMNAAVAAIQQGCELYKEYKGVVLKAKETFDEAKEHVDEVVGVWNFLKSKLFPDKESPPAKVVPDVKKSEKPRGTAPVTRDEQDIKKELIKNLKVFFKGMIAMDKKIKAQQERIDTEEIPPDELLDISLDHVVAKKAMEKLQKEIRETMVYQSPPELGALYTDVVEMFGLVQEKQEVTHLLNIRKRKEAIQRQERFVNKIRQRILWVIVMALLVMEIWGLTLAILLARPRL